MPKIFSRKLRGFTLIELLIVITIIGILATFIVASFTSAQAKARDGRRKSDMDAIKKALELSKGDSNGGAYYPGCTTTAPCNLPNVALLPPIAGSYIKTVPSDPTYGTTASGYTYSPNGAVASNTATSFNLTSCLENSNEATINNVTSTAAATCPGTRLYTISNP